MENCIINAKSKRPLNPRVRAAIINTTDWTEATWKNCRFYLSKGEGLMAVMDPEKDKKSTFTDCHVKDLISACSSPKLPAKVGKLKATENGVQSMELDFGKPVQVTISNSKKLQVLRSPGTPLSISTPNPRNGCPVSTAWA